MKYRNLAESTQQIYTSAVRELAVFLAADGRALAPADVHRRDIEAFVRHRLERVKPATVSADFRALQQFFKWLVREEEIDRSPSTARTVRSCRSSRANTRDRAVAQDPRLVQVELVRRPPRPGDLPTADRHRRPAWGDRRLDGG